MYIYRLCFMPNNSNGANEKKARNVTLCMWKMQAKVGVDLICRVGEKG